jgi:hypothetical protein
MSVSQVNENDEVYLSPELVYQMTISTRILAGTFAVRSSLSLQFTPNMLRVRR